jgi:diguanylate cyclase (GGDEF)-like protein
LERRRTTAAETALLEGLYERLPIVLAINAAVAIGTALVLGSIASGRTLAFWFAAMALSLGLRLADWFAYRRSGTPRDLARWRWRYTIGAGLTGLSWGMAGVLFYVPDVRAVQVFLPFVLSGMVGGSLMVLTGCMAAFIAFLVGTLVPYALRLASEGDLMHGVMAALLAFYMISLALLARQINASLMASVAFAAENERLIDALQLKQAQLQGTFDHINQGVAVFDRDGRLTAWNPRHGELHGYPEALYRAGTHVRAFLDHDLGRGALPPDPALILEPSAPARFEQAGAGDLVLAVERNAMPDGGFVTTSTDITPHKQAEARMRYLAQHDPLTQLPNRLLFHDRLQQAMAASRRHRRLLAVMLIDLDKFKAINDQQGHAVGDQVLQLVARRLRAGLRDSDTVARIGGDEFALILPELAEPAAALAIAHKALARLASPLTVAGHALALCGSLGIALYPNDGRTIEQLLQHADLAMYRAKAEGGGVRLFRPGAGSPAAIASARAS